MKLPKFLRFFEKRDDTSDLLNPKEWLIKALSRYRTITGVTVNEETAMTFSAVYACVRIISETIASLPLIVYKRLIPRGKERAPDHPLYRPLHLKPNKDMTSFTWRETLVKHMLLNGTGYNIILKNVYGMDIGLYPLISNRIRPDLKDNIYRFYYRFADNIERELPGEELLIIPGLSDNGIIGKSPIAAARESIGLGLTLDEFAARFFSNGTNIGAVAEHPGVLTKQGHDNLQSSLDEQYSSLGNSHKLMLLEEGMKFNKITIPPEDAQFLQSRKFQVNEVISLFNVDPHLIKDLDRATFNNIEQLGLEYVIYTIRPWLVRLEQAFNCWLFPDDKYFCEFLVDALLRGDIASRYQAYSTAKQNALMSANEIRELENQNPYDGGDTYWVQLNMQPVGQSNNVRKIIEKPDGTREYILAGNEVKAIESHDLTPKLAEKLGKAYKPLFVNAFIRIIKREKVDVLKIIREEFSENDLENYYEKHSKFVKSQIKPVIFAFVEAIYAEKDDNQDENVSIFSQYYSQDFTDRYIDSNLKQIKSIKKEDFEKKFDEWLEEKPESLSAEEIPKIIKTFNKYIEKIGS
ncbi:MAG: phage portal protein [Actinobacteria bacterium]|nr:phage portal protein [Actinomycetota bacterium]